MLQYKIPKNVELEDTIIGPITMKQLIICGVGGGLDYILYMGLNKHHFWYVWAPPVVVIGLLTVAIAFLEIRNIRFTKYILLMMEAFVLPNKRMWDKRQSTQFIFSTSSHQNVKEKKSKETEASIHEKKEEQVTNLNELTKALDISSLMGDSTKQEPVPAEPVVESPPPSSPSGVPPELADALKNLK